MGLDKETLKNDLINIFSNATNENNIDYVAEKMAIAIENFVKTGKAVGVDSASDTHNLTIQ